MSKRKPKKDTHSRLPELIDLRLIKGLGHVVRQHILLAAIQGEVSPSELSKALGEGVSQVSYHVRILRDDCDGLIEETRTEPRRGAVEHYYRANFEKLSATLKKGQTAALLGLEIPWNPDDIRAIAAEAEAQLAAS